MLHKRIYQPTLIMFTAILFGLVIFLPHVSADSAEFNFTTGCTPSTDGSYTAILDISSAKDVYSKLGTRGQKLKVSSYQVNESLEGGCRLVGETVINGDSWTKVGTLQPGQGRVVLEVISPTLTNVPNANRPAVLLVDTVAPICAPRIECEFTYNNQQAYIKAPTTLRDKASLFVGIPQDPKTDTLENVDYYVAGQLAYSKATLQPFDMRYVSYAHQQLLRVAHYKSGQEVVYTSRAPENFSDPFVNFMFRTLHLDSIISRIIISFISFILLLILMYNLMKLYVQRYRRLVYHGLMMRDTLRQKIGLYTEILLERIDYALERFYNQKFILWLRRNRTNFKYIAIFWIIPLFLLSSYFVVKNYVMVIYHVNGVSMTHTFKDGQTLYVNRLPQTFARINHSQLKLNRGDVVVVNAIYGLVSAEQIEENQHTIVKRVLGLPGETVNIHKGVVTVYEPGSKTGIKVDKGSSWESTMIKDPEGADIELTLGADEIFLSGDNRPGSVDSRLNGPVKVDQIIGKVIQN